MARQENQTRLITALRAFTGKLPPGYVDEKEFFLTSLHNMKAYLAEMQTDTLRENCDTFIARLEAGRVTQKSIDDFKARLDRLISNADFKQISAGMAGSKEYIKQKLTALTPMSIINEEAKSAGRDPEADRHITGTYARLNFSALAGQVERSPTDFSVNAALAGARAEVAEYCCLYRIPLGEADTLTIFSLACVDAALAAAYRLFKNIRQATGRAMQPPPRCDRD